ncbi:MAG TPA: low temperature requirement protein A [Steroidobacteraceae bacterium]|nr:low temperature requirement protein A [Steroidobacteraceae bacterium]
MSDTSAAESRSLLRSRAAHARVTNVELFFDLVFVFAVTQLSHRLHEHLSLGGALETGFLLIAVWWVWMYTCWFTNWVDPDRPTVRMLLFAAMLAGLLMSAAIPEAFAHEGLLFAIGYSFIQLVRTTFIVVASRRYDAGVHRNFLRILVWLTVSAVFWIAGGLLGGTDRMVAWVIALSIEIIGPMAGYHVPGLGRSRTSDWKIDGAHMAERCALFVIIALGESILVTGATAAEHPATRPAVCAFVIAFLGSVAMWWIYFNIGAERGSQQIATSGDPGRVGRAVYTYFHVPIIAGIVVCAVADEITIAHPDGHMSPAFALTLLGGPALYLLGNVFFKRASAKHYPLSHLVGLGILLVLAFVAMSLTPLALGAATTAALILVAFWETRSFRSLPEKESREI